LGITIDRIISNLHIPFNVMAQPLDLGSGDCMIDRTLITQSLDFCFCGVQQRAKIILCLDNLRARSSGCI
jgi:hypothetical protein